MHNQITNSKCNNKSSLTHRSSSGNFLKSVLKFCPVIHLIELYQHIIFQPSVGKSLFSLRAIRTVGFGVDHDLVRSDFKVDFADFSLGHPDYRALFLLRERVLGKKTPGEQPGLYMSPRFAWTASELTGSEPQLDSRTVSG